MEAVAPYQLELGPDVAYVQRLTSSPTHGADAKATFAPGMLGRAYLWPWLGVTVRYTRAAHTLELSPGALQTGGTSPLSAANDLKVTTLQGALQPTWHLRPTLAVFASAGAGWGSVVVPSIRVMGSVLSSIRQRRGVLLEAPLGLGVSWWVLPRWVNVSLESTYAITFGSSGDAYATDVYVNEQGRNATVGPMPTFTGSAYHHFTVALTL